MKKILIMYTFEILLNTVKIVAFMQANRTNGDLMRKLPPGQILREEVVGSDRDPFFSVLA